jgi:hypothetical protein
VSTEYFPSIFMTDDANFSGITKEQEKAFALFFDRIYLIAQTLEDEQKEYNKLLEKQVALRGTILTYHLVTEQLVTQELSRLKNLKLIHLKKRIDKMGYMEKLQALPRQIAYASIRKGLKELNEIRNRMAHDLEFVPSLTDIPLIIGCIKPFFEDSLDRKPKDLEGNLHFFLKISIGIFAARSGNTRHQIDKFIKSFPGTRKLLKRVIE